MISPIFDRLKEPSTWAALAAGVALLTGHDPHAVSDTAIQVIGGLSALAGMFMAENQRK
ncbi:MAG: hypothetical protein HQL73_02835 [Magnetococcales bacterium]|nr:hypothetical protein [Magnetococcales bacterium]